METEDPQFHLRMVQSLPAGQVFVLRLPGAGRSPSLRVSREHGGAYTSDLTAGEAEEIREWLLADTVPFTGKVHN